MDELQIKRQRRALHLTQQELAQKAGVSQSFIAKIESGLINPSYSLTTNILRVLEQERTKQQATAKEIAHKPLVTCAPHEEIERVIKKMRKHAISQIPVTEENGVVGLVTETGMLDHILTKNPKELKARDVMQPPPPIIDVHTPQDTVLSILKHTQLVVVTQKGKLYGAITRTDIVVNRYT